VTLPVEFRVWPLGDPDYYTVEAPLIITPVEVAV